MKKIVLLSSLVLLFTLQLTAGNAELFRLDENTISEKFQNLNQLENFVLQNEGISLHEMQNVDKNLIGNIDLNGIVLGNMSEPPLGIPSFLWGCVLGWVGILVVYLVSEDKNETKQALYGCLVGGVAYIVFYVVYVALIISATTV